MTRAGAGVPRLQLLSNGRYHVMVTREGAGFSRWNDLAVSRWREDATRDGLGQFCYLRDVSGGLPWSTTAQPTGLQGDWVESTFSPGRASLLRRHAGSRAGVGFDIESRTDIAALRLRPCLPPHWEGDTLSYRHRSTAYRIQVLPTAEHGAVPAWTVDGLAREGNCLPLIDDGADHMVLFRLARTGDSPCRSE